MKKSMVLLGSVLVLTACAQPKKEAKESTENKTEQSTKASSSAKEEKGLKFVVAPQNEGKTSDLIELGKKLVTEHPEIGAQGEITVYFTGGTLFIKIKWSSIVYLITLSYRHNQRPFYCFP